MKEPLQQRICNSVNARMQSTGLCRRDLAVLLGVSPQRVSQILSGKINLKCSTIEQLADFFGCHESELTH